MYSNMESMRNPWKLNPMLSVLGRDKSHCCLAFTIGNDAKNSNISPCRIDEHRQSTHVASINNSPKLPQDRGYRKRYSDTILRNTARRQEERGSSKHIV